MTFTQFPPIDGDVVGPASAANNNLAAFDGVTGKLIKDSGIATTGIILRTQVPYDLSCQYIGVPGASAVGLRFVAVRAFTLSASGQQGTAGTAATAQADFLVAVNGVTRATLRFAAAGTTITIVGGTATTIAAGDIILITAPASPDATLADVGFTLTGLLI